VLRRLHEEATPGPWRHVEKGRVFNDHHLVTEGYVKYPGDDDPEDETDETLAAEALTARTGVMIAALRNALPALADLVAEVEANHEDHAVVPIATCRDPLCRVYAALRERLEARP
jgi:hypothetical protein